MTMTQDTQKREVVGLLAGKADLDACIKALESAGFDHSDISILSSHESPDLAANTPGDTVEDTSVAALDEPLRYAFPLTTAGLIAVVGGPISAVLGGIIAAGVAGMAAKDYIDALISHPKPGEFARALEAGGVILWIYAATGNLEAKAVEILSAHGATNIHTSVRKDKK